jgi:hypothetical protein
MAKAAPADRERRFLVPGVFLDAVERLLTSTPPPASAKDRKTLAEALNVVARAKSRQPRKTRQ